MPRGFTSDHYLALPLIGITVFIVYVIVCLITGTPLHPQP